MSRFNRSFMPINWRLVFILIFFLISAISIPWVGLEYGCLSAYDLGIFSQVVQSAWRGEWNPFVPAREMHAMQDHWDPIVTLLAWLFFPLKFLFSAPRFLLVLEAVTVGAAGLYARSALLKRGFSESRAFFALILILFSPVTWNALRFPVHPTAWALLPSLGFVVWVWDGLRAGRFSVAWGLLWGLLLWTCGEQFGLGWAAGMITLLVLGSDRKRVGALTVLAMGLAWWAWKGRALYYDGVYHHAHRLRWSLDAILAGYDFRFSTLLKTAMAGLFFVGPLAFLFVWLKDRHWNDFNFETRFLIVVLGFLSPLILGRILAASWGSHYGIFCLAGLFALLFLPVPEFSRRAYVLFSILVIATGISGWGKVFHLAIETAPGCDGTSGEVSEEVWSLRKSELREIIEKIPSGSHVMANSFLVPSILNLRSDLVVHSTASFQLADRSQPMNFVIVTKDPLGNQWPLDIRGQKLLNDRLGELGSLQSLQTLDVWRGAFLPNMFDVFSTTQPMAR